jgi:opacity protein-like surface antigen
MRFCFVALMVVAAASAPAAAQDQTTAPPESFASRPTPDFFFGRPYGSLAVRGSWSLARAGSDWYDFVTDQLTLQRNDFNAPGFAVDVGITVTDRVEAVVGVDVSRMSASSEYRRFVDNNRQPINQTTRLNQVNVTGGMKLALRERGRRVSALAWIPRGLVPYLGGGAGMLWYDLSQEGDFIDALDPRLAVFTDVFESHEWTPTAHVSGGVDVRVARSVFVTFDARYRWAAGDLSRQWVSFDPIDLSGLRLSTGISVSLQKKPF